jgi:hypothetical protein
LFVGEFGVAWVLTWAFRVVHCERWRLHVEAAAPFQDLFLAVFLCHIDLVEALQLAVALLVEAPCLVHRQPVHVHHIEDVVECFDSSLEV